ncbi:MAG: inverse autotransporter beta domain-containing protein [Planctomycetaceae bacterium]|nr:inverse autotransporter beta domain-containing protein [Planctomycetaceae bacterium]
MASRGLRASCAISALLGVVLAIAARAQDLAPFQTIPPSQVVAPPLGSSLRPAGIAGLFHWPETTPGPGVPEPWSMDGETPYVQRFGVAHEAGDGLGWRDGLTTIEFTTPLKGDLVFDNLFGDARFVILNDATTAANVGLGYRWYNLDQNRIWGINAFFDYRQTDLNQFTQAGVGVESLGALVDFRANAYIPDVGEIVGPVPGLFFGHLLLTNRDEIAMTGGDIEAGICLLDTDRVQTRLFGGGYYFDGHRNDDAVGWKARGEVALDQQLWLDAAVQDDQVFGTTVSVSLAIRCLKRQMPPAPQALKPMDHVFFRRAGDADAANIAHRLSAPIKRLQTVVLSQQPEIATDPAGVPLNFLHVVNGGAGTGTFEDPYGTLTAALADAAAGTSIIYTPEGGAFVENIALVPGARVLSNGPVQRVETQFGPTRLPFSGSGTVFSDLPTLTGDVDMADDSQFSGFDVTGQVTATGVSGFTIDNTRIDNAGGDALVITGADDSTLDNLSLESTGGRGLFLNDSSSTITNLTVTTASTDGVEVRTTGVDREVSLQNLTVSNASSFGVDVNVAGAGSLDLSITGTNSISSVNNAIDAALLGGSTGDLILSLDNATLSSTGGAGVNLDGTAGAGTLFVASFSNNIVPLGGGGGVLADTVTFDADPTTVAIETVNAGTLAIGDSDAAVEITGDGVRLIDPTGALDFSTLDIFNSGGTGLLVDTKGGGTTFSLSTGSASTITTTGGPAMSLDPLDVNLAFDAVQSTTSPTNGIFIDTTTGNIQIGTTTINNSVLPSIVIQNTPAPLSVNFGTTTILSTISDVFADNIDTTVGNGANLSIDFTTLTITGP